MDWMQDIECFLRQFHDILEGSAMHIYHSALPFTPSSSLIRKHYAKELENEVQIIHGQPQGWDRSSRALAITSIDIYTSRFSHDNKILVDVLCDNATLIDETP